MADPKISCEGKKYTILIIEDSKVFSKVLAKSLQKTGHSTVQAYSLQQGIEQIESKDFDFIILDLILPDGEGDQIIDELPKKMRQKVIVLSADKDIQRRDYLFESGVLDYFSKSNPLDMILKDINDLLCELEYNETVNVLTVDDSDFMRRMIKTVLAPKKYNIFEAEGAKEGMEILKNNTINLLLLDYEMPDIDGAQMLEQIKSQKEFLSLPVIVVSSKNDKEIIARVLKHGANDFIHKPFSTEELLLKCDLQIKEYIHFQLLQQKEKQLHEAVEKLHFEKNAKSEFLANMSHEVRTPLNAIVGFVDLLQEKIDDKGSKEYLDIIDSSSQHLLGVINDILDLSKIDNKKLEIEKNAFDVKKLFHNTIALFQAVAKQKNVSLHLAISQRVPEFVSADELRIKQVVSNLLSNAVKFTPNDKTVTLRLDYTEGLLSVEVIDEGIGIAEEKLENIFEEFSQADSSTTRQYGGTGLGLSISSKLVGLMGSKLQVQSRLHEGSCFYFSLPVAPANGTKPIDEQRQNKEIELENILLVEDNEANQMFMKVLLKKFNANIVVASDGLEAVEKFKNETFDLILMDESMPNLSGIEATKQILEIEQTWQKPHTPIIALTANALKGDREKFLEAGMDEYMTKPVDRKKLQKIFSKIFAQTKIAK
ncbi:MAG: response regulator [Campylobacterota bacterium]